MYKLLITDLDGTAVPKGSQARDIDSHLLKSISELNINNKLISCATGRNWKLAKPLIKKMGFVHPCIVSGGSMIIDPISESIIWQKKINHEDACFVFKLFKNIKQDLRLEISYSNDDRYRLKDLEKLTVREPNFLYLLGSDLNTANFLIKEINHSHRDIIAYSTPSWSGDDFVDIHVTHSAGTKKHGVEKLLSILSIKKNEVIGMGDSNNDIPLLNSVGFKISTRDGSRELKEISDYITPYDNGRALNHVINKFLLKKIINSNRKISAGGVVYHDGKFLLIKSRNENEVAFPKGTVEPCESFKGTVLREVLEETGYHSSINKYIDNTEYKFYKNNELYTKNVYFYLLELIDPSEIPRPNFQNDEDYENIWLDYESAYEKLTHADNKRILQKTSQLINK